MFLGVELIVVTSVIDYREREPITSIETEVLRQIQLECTKIKHQQTW